MATITPTVVNKGRWLVATWSGVTENDTPAAMYLNHNVSDMFIEVDGTVNGSAITLNGFVVDGANSATALVDPAGTAISLTAQGSSAIRDAWPNLQPVTDGNGTSENFVIRMYFKIVL